MHRFVLRAWDDARAHFGPNKETFIGAPLVFFSGVGISWLFRGREIAMNEVWSYLIFGIIGVGIAFSGLFLFHLILAPYRIERDRANAEKKRADEAEARLAIKRFMHTAALLEISLHPHPERTLTKGRLNIALHRELDNGDILIEFVNRVDSDSLIVSRATGPQNVTLVEATPKRAIIRFTRPYAMEDLLSREIIQIVFECLEPIGPSA